MLKPVSNLQSVTCVKVLSSNGLASVSSSTEWALSTLWVIDSATFLDDGRSRLGEDVVVTSSRKDSLKLHLSETSVQISYSHIQANHRYRWKVFLKKNRTHRIRATRKPFKKIFKNSKQISTVVKLSAHCVLGGSLLPWRFFPLLFLAIFLYSPKLRWSVRGKLLYAILPLAVHLRYSRPWGTAFS